MLTFWENCDVTSGFGSPGKITAPPNAKMCLVVLNQQVLIGEIIFIVFTTGENNLNDHSLSKEKDFLTPACWKIRAPPTHTHIYTQTE